MKVLFVCHRFPYPPKRGGKIRPFNMIRHLSEQGHEVTVASLVRSGEEAQEGRGLDKFCSRYLVEPVSPPAAMARMLLRLPSRAPSSMGYFYSPRLRRRIKSLFKEMRFDFILVHCSSVAQYVEDVRGIPKMLDFGDMDSQKWLIYSGVRSFPLSAGYRVEGTKLQRAEMALARKFDFCSCTTRAELETLDGFQTGARSGWFPNGVDADYFQPGTEPYDPDTLCFVGRMDYFPNQEAAHFLCREILPLLRRARPALRLTIVGADPSRAIRNLGKLPGVSITGSVPDVRPFVRQSALSVAPLSIARGTQNKILESMALGTPVVTSVQASGGVDAVPGEHLLSASSPQEYRDAILRLLSDPGERERLSRAGRARVLERHDWAASMARMDVLISECRAVAAGGSG